MTGNWIREREREEKDRIDYVINMEFERIIVFRMSRIYIKE